MMSAGFAFARAASHPIMSGVRDLNIAAGFLAQNKAEVTTSRLRSGLKCRHLVEDGFPHLLFRPGQDRRWQLYRSSRNRSTRKWRRLEWLTSKDSSLR